jgi:hypothetical protein
VTGHEDDLKTKESGDVGPREGPPSIRSPHREASKRAQPDRPVWRLMRGIGRAGVTAQQAPRASAHPARSSSRVVGRMDRAVARVPRVQPRDEWPRQAVATTSSPPFETALLVSAVRCTLRYIVLPLVLPLLGIATSATLGIVTGAALGILVTLDVIAAIAIVATLRQLWRCQHPRRWQHLPVALALAVLVGHFFLNDARAVRLADMGGHT